MKFSNAAGALCCLLFSLSALAQTPIFHAPTVLPAQTAPLAIAAADFNGDGFQDLAIGNAESETISIYLGNGTGQFTPSTTINLRNCQVGYLTAAKFTGAPQPDILAV